MSSTCDASEADAKSGFVAEMNCTITLVVGDSSRDLARRTMGDGVLSRLVARDEQMIRTSHALSQRTRKTRPEPVRGIISMNGRKHGRKKRKTTQSLLHSGMARHGSKKRSGCDGDRLSYPVLEAMRVPSIMKRKPWQQGRGRSHTLIGSCPIRGRRRREVEKCSAVSGARSGWPVGMVEAHGESWRHNRGGFERVG